MIDYEEFFDHIDGLMRTSIPTWNARASTRPTVFSEFSDPGLMPACDGRFESFVATDFGVRPRPNAMVGLPVAGTSPVALAYLQRKQLFYDPLRILHFAPEAILEQRFRALTNIDMSLQISLARQQ